MGQSNDRGSLRRQPCPHHVFRHPKPSFRCTHLHDSPENNLGSSHLDQETSRYMPDLRHRSIVSLILLWCVPMCTDRLTAVAYAVASDSGLQSGLSGPMTSHSWLVQSASGVMARSLPAFLFSAFRLPPRRSKTVYFQKNFQASSKAASRVELMLVRGKVFHRGIERSSRESLGIRMSVR